MNGPTVDDLIARYRAAMVDVDLTRDRLHAATDDTQRHHLRRDLIHATADAFTEARHLLDVLLAERET